MFFLFILSPHLLKLPDEIGPLGLHQIVADSLVCLFHGAEPHRVEHEPLQKPKSSKSALVLSRNNQIEFHLHLRSISLLAKPMNAS